MALDFQGIRSGQQFNIQTDTVQLGNWMVGGGYTGQIDGDQAVIDTDIGTMECQAGTKADYQVQVSQVEQQRASANATVAAAAANLAAQLPGTWVLDPSASDTALPYPYHSDIETLVFHGDGNVDVGRYGNQTGVVVGDGIHVGIILFKAEIANDVMTLVWFDDNWVKRTLVYHRAS